MESFCLSDSLALGAEYLMEVGKACLSLCGITAVRARVRVIGAPVFSMMLCLEEELFHDWRRDGRRMAFCVDNVSKKNSKNKIFI